jgi:hypothetical protein
MILPKVSQNILGHDIHMFTNTYKHNEKKNQQRRVLLKKKKIFHDWMKKTNGHNWKEFEVDTLIATF